MLPVGGHTVDCTHALRERIQAIFTDPDAENEFTALRAPVETDANVRIPTILEGWPDPKADRTVPHLPFAAVRAVSGGPSIEGAGRQTTYQVAIGVHCEEVADYEFAQIIAERIWLNLYKRPAISSGLYLIQNDEITWAEDAELAQNWQCYVVKMTVPVILPAFLQTEDENGETTIWENKSFGS